MPTQILKTPRNVGGDDWHVQSFGWATKPGFLPFVKHVRSWTAGIQVGDVEQAVIISSDPKLLRHNQTGAAVAVVVETTHAELIIDYQTVSTGAAGQLTPLWPQFLIDDVWPWEMYWAVKMATANRMTQVNVCWTPVRVGVIEQARLAMEQTFAIPRGG